MDGVPLGRDPDRRYENEIASLFDAPAYIRRARGVEAALTAILDRARARRDEWLEMPRLRLGQLHALAGAWYSLVPHLRDEEEVEVLALLEAVLQPRLRVPLEPTSSPRVLAAALDELVGSLERFNDRWRAYLATIDLAPVNALRDGYNRYYVLEKACALRSDLLARQGFRPLPPLDIDELARHLPLLPVPRRAGE